MLQIIVRVFQLCILLYFLCALSCSRTDAPKKISLEKQEPVPASEAANSRNPIRMAVGGMITPRDGFIYYRELLDHIGKKTGRPVEFIDREKYDEVNALLKSGDIDVAFVCSGPYVEGRKEFGMELLAAPQVYGKPLYYSYIIVPKDSPASRFEDLRGKKFAFTDPDSNSGKLVPTYMLATMNETPESYFSTYVFTYGHDKSIKAVAQGLVDGAAVDSLIWDYADRTNPQYTAKTRIIKKSPPYGIPPVVTRPGLSADLKRAVKQVLLSAHTDPEGGEILKKMMIDRFVEIDDHAYDSVRDMKAWIAKRPEKAIKTP